MTSWPAPLSYITLFVDDLATTRAFYEEVFGRAPVYTDDDSAVFAFGDGEAGAIGVNLPKSTQAPELIEPAVVAEAASGSRMQLTIPVDDVDATCAMLAERGVTLLNGPTDRPWGIRTAAFRDPAGHVWEIAH
jgi:catechol 2,3-dioxygenase-like lactoylglutathione lyase family enzyme